MNTLHKPVARIALLFCLLASGPALAQTRTWVSGVGDDINPCSRTAPCKTFAGAISKTAAGGEIDVLDPGGFGAVTITKSITIDGNGQLSSILAAGTSGIIVNAGAADVVIIRNLSINGATTGVDGIRFLAGGALHVEDVTIEGFANGINLAPSGASEATISRSRIAQNTTGINLLPTGVGVITAAIDDVVLDANTTGLKAGSNSIAALHNSSVTGNTGNGVWVLTTGGALARVTVADSMLTTNNFNPAGTLAALHSEGPSSELRYGGNLIAQNGLGLLANNSGDLISLGNNYVDGNSPNGTPTATEATQ